MEFNSLTFSLLILPIFICLMFLIKQNKIRNIIILIFSLGLYLIGSPNNFHILIATILLTYLVGKNVKNNRNIYIAYLIVLICLLSYFKFGNYFLDTINSIINGAAITNIIMPMGISFYIFTSIGYVSDCYRGKIESENNILKLACFISFFPTIVSGPILRYGSYKEYLEEKNIDFNSIASGFRRFIIGLGKKVIIANQLAIVSNLIFKGNVELSFLLSWYGALAYMIQIYFDFSGYSDMAIGISEMIGYKVDENFNYPYVSVSIQEFWRRWHISLGSWFKDYVYIPLGGNKVGTVRLIINTLVVWLLTGLWHGSTFNFVLWGLYNFVLLMGQKLIFKNIKVNKIIGYICTMGFVLIGWVIFNTTSLFELKAFVKAMIGLGANDNLLYIKSLDVLYILPYFILGFIGCFPIVSNLLKKIENKCAYLYDIYLLIVLIISIVFIVSGSYSSFIYFNF